MDVPQQSKYAPSRHRPLVALTSFLTSGRAVPGRTGWHQPPSPSVVALVVGGSVRPALLRATHRDHLAFEPAVSLPATPLPDVQGAARAQCLGPLKRKQPREPLAWLP
jgi:hypothetical protein